MVLAASMFVDYRSERPRAAVGSLDRRCRGLSGPGFEQRERSQREIRRSGNEIDADRRDATRPEPVCGLRDERRDRSII